MHTKIIKSQKPIEYDAHLKYRCPNDQCYQIHWLSLLEAKTKNFKVVCDCGCVFKPKQINSIKIYYEKKHKVSTQPESAKTTNSNTIDNNLLEKTVAILVNYGFTSKESEAIVKQAYIKNPTDDCAFLVKQCLLLIGEQHE